VEPQPVARRPDTPGRAQEGGCQAVERSLQGRAAPDSPSYLIHLTLFFNARHQVSFAPNVGPVHRHSWRIEAQLRTFFRNPFDSSPVEFADLEERIPTTENLARFLFGRVGQALAPTGVEIVRATVWEAPTKGVTVVTPLPASVEQGLPGVGRPADVQLAALREAAAGRDAVPASPTARKGIRGSER